MIFYNIAFILCIPKQVSGIGIQIDGLIDLGPEWSYKYKLSPIEYGSITTTLSSVKIRKDNEYTKNTVKFYIKEHANGLKDIKLNTSKLLHALKNENIPRKYTKNGLDDSNTQALSEDNFKDKVKAKKKKHSKYHKRIKDNIRLRDKTKAKKVRDDDKVRNFTLHIYKQSLKVFDNLRIKSSSYKMRHKFKVLQKIYMDKFGDFVKHNEKNTLRTRLSSQKVILNIIDTSNTIMQRLLNYLAKDIDENDKIYSGYINMFQNEVNRENDIEYIHACKKFGACRTKDDYNEFIIDVITIILQANNYKIKQTADALTEIVTTNDYSNIMDTETESKLKKIMNDIEKWDVFLIRAMFSIFKIVLINKNKPIAVMETSDLSLANKTIAFHDLINDINKYMDDEKNKREWEEFKKELEEWKDGKRSDIQSILDKIIKQLIRELEKLDYKLKQRINELLKIVLTPTKK